MSLTFNNLDFESITNAEISVNKREGFDMPKSRLTEYLRPKEHGSKIYADYLSPRVLSLEGVVHADTETNLLSALDSMKKELNPGTEGTLTKDTRRIKCFAIGFDYIFGLEFAFGVRFKADFKAQDPALYSTTLESSNINLPTATGGFSFPLSFPLAFGTVSVGGVYIASNDGSIAVYPELVRIYGPVDNPQLKNVTTGEYIKISLSVASGDYLELNFKEKTIMLNGTASRYSYLDAVSTWFKLKLGNNEIRYTANTYQAGSYCQFQFRDGYL